MTPATPSPGHSPHQRALAAIVFTDVVSFSARMQADELGTLKLLQRDFAEMRRICAEHEGAVLKTTGDGLLLTFTSAVQAVACALAMQRQFAAEAKHAAGGGLQHRIGIHLGDVLVQDQDVMGDGVNIASRLQAEAEPGGICISQTVYDVVKNKLEMNVVSLGERELKNISHAMPVYQLLLEAQALDAKGGPRGAPTPRASSAGSKLPWLIGAGAVVVAAILAVVVFRGREPAPPPAGPVAAPAVVQEKTDLADTLATGFNKRRNAMAQLHERYLDKYDFNGLVAALRDKAEAPSAPAGLKQMLRNAEQLAALKEWLDLDLRRYSAQRPLIVRELSTEKTPRQVAVYMAADGRVAFLDKGTPQPHDWPELTPNVVGAIIVSAVHEASRAPRSIHAAAQVFARFYTLPLMTEALEHAGR